MPMRSPETVDLGDVAREAAALFEGEVAENDHASFFLEMADRPLWIMADREELRRVIINLLTNALQALASGEPGEIRMRSGEVDGCAQLSVQDTGSGIPEEVQPKVFQPSFSTKTSGMGLGLAISRRAIEAVGGTITFDTEAGEGTTFTVRMPFAPVEPPRSEPSSGDAVDRQLDAPREPGVRG